MKLTLRILILCLYALTFPGLQTQAEAGRPCAEDAAKLCKEIQFGGGRITNCLKEHEQQLSPACKEHQLAMIKRLREAPGVCQDDVEQHCSEVRPVNRRILRCLKEHQSQLSAECGEKMKSVN